MNEVFKSMLRTYFLLFYFLLSFANYSFGQIPETNPDLLRIRNWIFGDSIAISFFPNDTIKISSSKIQGTEACGTFSDSKGNLMYYSDGVSLFDSTGNIIGLIQGDKSSVQGVVFFGSDSVVHLTTTTDIGGSEGFNHYIMKNGSIVGQKKLLAPVGEMQCVGNHANGRFHWLVVHEFKSKNMYVFLATDEQVLCPSVVESQSYLGDKGSNAPGNLSFSRSGANLALTIYSLDQFSADGIVELYSFDKESGRLQHRVNSHKLWLPLYTKFSSDETKLYVSERGRNLVQLNISTPYTDSVKSSEVVLWTAGSPFSNIALQYGHGGEIYGAIPDSLYLASIVHPNEHGRGSGFEQRAIDLRGKKVSKGLPNFNSSYFYTPSIDFAYVEDCWNHNYQFEGRDTIKADSWKWLFEKGNTRDSLSTKHGSYTFPDTGRWQVSHIASNGTRTDTITKTLTIHPKFQNNFLGNDTFICKKDFKPFNIVVPSDMHCVHWNGEEPNLDDSKGTIIDYDHFHTDTFLVDTPGTYYVRITNKTFCQMWDTIVVGYAPQLEKPNISISTGSLASTLKAVRYRWFVDGTFYRETSKEVISPTKNGYYQVQLISEYGCESELSDSFFVDWVSVPLAVKESIKIYPNPSDGMVNIRTKEGQLVLVEVLDVSGKTILEKHLKENEFQLDMNGKPKGTYLLKLRLESGKVFQKEFILH